MTKARGQRNGAPGGPKVVKALAPTEWRPSHQGGGSHSGPNVTEAPAPMRGGGGVPKHRRPLTNCGKGVTSPNAAEAPHQRSGGSKAVEVPTPMRRRFLWSQCGGGPCPRPQGAKVVPKQWRSVSQCGRDLGDPNAAEAPVPKPEEPKAFPKKGEGGGYPNAAGSPMIPYAAEAASPLPRGSQ